LIHTQDGLMRPTLQSILVYAFSYYINRLNSVKLFGSCLDFFQHSYEVDK